MEWLDAHHPEYVDRLAGHVATGRIEIIGGAFFEPILAMIPSATASARSAHTPLAEKPPRHDVRGMWIPERVWEQSIARDLVDAGIEYTILDDSHFKKAGLTDQI